MKLFLVSYKIFKLIIIIVSLPFIALLPQNSIVKSLSPHLVFTDTIVITMTSCHHHKSCISFPFQSLSRCSPQILKTLLRHPIVVITSCHPTTMYNHNISISNSISFLLLKPYKLTLSQHNPSIFHIHVRSWVFCGKKFILIQKFRGTNLKILYRSKNIF